MLKVHVLNDLVRANDLNNLESMVLLLFAFKYRSSIVNAIFIHISKVFSDSLLVELLPYLSLCFKQHIILCPFSVPHKKLIE